MICIQDCPQHALFTPLGVHEKVKLQPTSIRHWPTAYGPAYQLSLTRYHRSVSEELVKLCYNTINVKNMHVISLRQQRYVGHTGDATKCN